MPSNHLESVCRHLVHLEGVNLFWIQMVPHALQVLPGVLRAQERGAAHSWILAWGLKELLP